MNFEKNIFFYSRIKLLFNKPQTLFVNIFHSQNFLNIFFLLKNIKYPILW